MLALAEYASGCSRTIASYAAVSSARAFSTEAPGARRPKSSVIRCMRSMFIVAPMWCGLVTMLAMISVSAGYGIDGSRTPTIVAVRAPRLIGLPTTAGSLLKKLVQKRYVRTTAPAAS